MSDSSQPSPIFKALVTASRERATAGLIGGEVTKAKRARWNPDDHPRDLNGRFIEVGGIVELPDGSKQRVTDVKGGKVRVEDADGKVTTITDGTELTQIAGANDPDVPLTSPKEEKERAKEQDKADKERKKSIKAELKAAKADVEEKYKLWRGGDFAPEHYAEVNAAYERYNALKDEEARLGSDTPDDPMGDGPEANLSATDPDAGLPAPVPTSDPAPSVIRPDADEATLWDILTDENADPALQQQAADRLMSDFDVTAEEIEDQLATEGPDETDAEVEVPTPEDEGGGEKLTPAALDELDDLVTRLDGSGADPAMVSELAVAIENYDETTEPRLFAAIETLLADPNTPPELAAELTAFLESEDDGDSYTAYLGV